MLLVLLFSAICCSTENSKDNSIFGGTTKVDLERMNLNGNIKQIKEMEFLLLTKDSKYEKGSQVGCYDIYYFNERGNISQVNSFRSPNDGCGILIHNYNERGLKTEIRFIPSSGPEYVEERFRYDRNNKVIEKIFLPEREDQVTANYIYKDDKISTIQYSIYNSPSSTETFIYNDKGRVLEKKEFATGSLLVSYVYKYNNNGDVTEIKCFLPSGELDETRTYKYKYDSKGNWIEKVSIEDAGNRFLTRKITYVN